MGQIYSLLETSAQQYNDVTCVEHSYDCFQEKEAADVEVGGLTVLEVEHSGSCFLDSVGVNVIIS